MLNSNYEHDLNTSFKCGVFWRFFFSFLLLSPLMVALLALLSSGGVSYMPCVQASALGQQGPAQPRGQQGFQLACGSRVGVRLGLAPADLQGLRCVQGLYKFLTLKSI